MTVWPCNTTQLWCTLKHKKRPGQTKHLSVFVQKKIGQNSSLQLAAKYRIYTIYQSCKTPWELSQLVTGIRSAVPCTGFPEDGAVGDNASHHQHKTVSPSPQIPQTTLASRGQRGDLETSSRGHTYFNKSNLSPKGRPIVVRSQHLFTVVEMKKVTKCNEESNVALMFCS